MRVVLIARYCSGPALEVTSRCLADGLAETCASCAAATRSAPKALRSAPASAISRCEATDSSWPSEKVITSGMAVRTWSLSADHWLLRSRRTELPWRYSATR